MVHAYLMYGFPTQTEQETIDSLEMVRQMFETGVLRSAFWHLFTMTAHSPVGLEPEKYLVKKINEVPGSFANNDLEHVDPTGASHEIYGYGLKKALLNYMHGACFELPLQKWFDFKIPKTSIPADFIRKAIEEPEYAPALSHYKIAWLGNTPATEIITRSKKGNQWEVMQISFQSKKQAITIQVDSAKGKWLVEMLDRLNIHKASPLSLKMIKQDYEEKGHEDFELFWDNKPVNGLYKAGLLVL
jgi:hypothetical protein